MKRSFLAASAAVWSVVGTAAWGHPGHLLDDAAVDVTHRVTSIHHWGELALLAFVSLLAAGWVAKCLRPFSRRTAATVSGK